MQGQKLKELVHEYVINYSRMRNFSPRTVESKQGVFKRLLRWLGDRELDEESALEYMKHISALGWQPSSCKSELKYLKAFGNWLVKRRYQEHNFARFIESPKVPKKHLQFCTAEVAEEVILAGTKIEGSSKTRKSRIEQREALQMLLRTGLRVSELVKLKGTDINFDNETFQVLSKGGNQDILPLPRDLIPMLKERAGNGRLFKVDKKVLRLSLARGSQIMKVKPKLRPHSLRHIFCTSLLRQGLALQKVSRLMRHASVQLTDSVYSHYIIDDLKIGLNSYHPVIRQQLEPLEVFKQLDELIESSGIKGDDRFLVNVSQDTNNLHISISTKQ